MDILLRQQEQHAPKYLCVLSQHITASCGVPDEATVARHSLGDERAQSIRGKHAGDDTAVYIAATGDTVDAGKSSRHHPLRAPPSAGEDMVKPRRRFFRGGIESPRRLASTVALVPCQPRRSVALSLLKGVQFFIAKKQQHSLRQ